MAKEFVFHKNHEAAEKAHQEHWLSLTPYERWKANWEMIRLLYKNNPPVKTESEKNRFVLK